VLDIDTSRTAFVMIASTSLNVLHRRLTLGESLTLLRPGKLPEQGANIAATKRVDEGGLSREAVAEHFEFDAGQRRLVNGIDHWLLDAVHASAARSNHSSSQLLDVRVTSVGRHRLQVTTSPVTSLPSPSFICLNEQMKTCGQAGTPRQQNCNALTGVLKQR